MINMHKAIWHKYPGIEGITIIGDKITEWPEAVLGPKPTTATIQVLVDEYEATWEAEKPAREMAELRKERNILLVSSDWTQYPDSPLTGR
jgi:hypothetical protein